MALPDYDWNKYYDFRSMDIEKDFYIPVFKRSKELMRVTGSFSSFFLKAHPKAYAQFVEKEDAQIRLITGSDLDKKDVKAIMDGKKKPAEVFRNEINIENLKNEISNNTLKVISWLVSEGKMQVKIGFVHSDGEIKTHREAEFHKKEAIWQDKQGNMISIIGSPNLSYKAMKNSSESFDIQRSWITYEGRDERDSINRKKELFEDYWRNAEDNHRFFDVTDVFEDILSNFKPSEPPKPERLVPSKFTQGFNYDTLRTYQKDAIKSWKNNGKEGILKMATGTGKTWTALIGIGDIASSSDLIVISVPIKDLVDQWAEEIKEVFDSPQILKCYSDNDWKRRLKPFLLSNSNNLRFMITTNASSEIIVDKVGKIDYEFDTYYIFDEVHHMGTQNKREKVLDKISNSEGLMGLSATPERNDDDETDALFGYFGDIVFNYPLSKAIREGFLSQYEYHVNVVSLNEDEREEYMEISKQISKRVAMKDFESFEDEVVKADDLKPLFAKRSRILKECKEKHRKTIEILQNNPYLGRTIVFTGSRNHLEEVAEGISNDTNYSYPLKFHAKTDNRDEVLNQFEKGHHDILIGIKCLDEGIDVPECNNAVILSSSTTEREFTQRRGRVLRQSDNNKPAKIFDFFVIPYELEDLQRGVHTINEKEEKILEKELDRIDKFAENSLNDVEVNLRIRKLKGRLSNMVDGNNG